MVIMMIMVMMMMMMVLSNVIRFTCTRYLHGNGVDDDNHYDDDNTNYKDNNAV